MRKMLMVATVPSMIGQFNMNNIKILQESGYEVHIACDFTDRSVWNEERIMKFQNDIKENGVKGFQIDFSRSAIRINKHIHSYKQLLHLTKESNYTFIHCHTPIAGAIARLVCKKASIKCIYTAHGFHFYTGAPIKNWLFFYPIEKILSKYTDVLITLNHEDYQRALKKLKAKKVEYIPGIGINTEVYSVKKNDRIDYRRKLNLNKDEIMIMSIGELNKNKNHSIVLEAISKLNDKNIHYFIAGEGIEKEHLVQKAKQLSLENNFHLLGYRTDINELLHCTDIYVHPSFREGMPVSLMEAIASEVYCIASDIRGNKDLIKNNDLLFNPKSVESIVYLLSQRKFIYKKDNYISTQLIDKNNCIKMMERIYDEM